MNLDSQKSLKVVLDTCVCVDLITERDMTSARCAVEALKNPDVFKSRKTMNELRRVMNLPDVERHINPIISELFFAHMAKAKLVDVSDRDIQSVSSLIAHDGDQSFLALADKAGANYLITRDNGLLDQHSFRGVEIVDPREFLEIACQVDCPEYRCGRAADGAEDLDF